MELLDTPGVVLVSEDAEALCMALGLRIPAAQLRDLSTCPAVREYFLRRARAGKFGSYGQALDRVASSPRLCTYAEYCRSLLSNNGYQPRPDYDLATRTRGMCELYRLLQVPIEHHYTAYRQYYAGLQLGSANGYPIDLVYHRVGSIPDQFAVGPLHLPAGRKTLMTELAEDHTLHRTRWRAPHIHSEVILLLDCIRSMLWHFAPEAPGWSSTPFRDAPAGTSSNRHATGPSESDSGAGGATAGKKPSRAQERSAARTAKSGGGRKPRAPKKKTPAVPTMSEPPTATDAPSGISLGSEDEGELSTDPTRSLRDEFADETAADAEVERVSRSDDDNGGDADFHPLVHGDRETAGHSGPVRY